MANATASNDDSTSDGEAMSGERKIDWMVRTADGVVGPVSLDLIERGLNLGRVPEDAEIAPANSDSWRSVRELIPIDDAPPVDSVPEDAAPIVAAEVVSIGDEDVAWPTSFAPSSAKERLPPPAHTETCVALPVATIPTLRSPTPPPSRAPSTSSPAAEHSAPAGPISMPSFRGDESITIPKKSNSPALIAFGVTIAACAVIAAAVAIVQAL